VVFNLFIECVFEVKLKCFSYNIVNTPRTSVYENMTVNPKLAELMRVIEDNQDKIPEGEYLAAMNALGALHRELPAVAVAVAVAAPPPPLFMGERTRALGMPPGMEDRSEQAAWYRVASEHPHHTGISPDEWIGFSEEERKIFVREATEIVANRMEACCRNPAPEECPFIARHAVGNWQMEGVWECVCGYKGYCRNWQRHEQGERHQDWAKHRTVSRRKIGSMKCEIRRDERGDLCRYNPLSQTDFSGIRCFITRQERNEWTHPELYTESQRSPIPTADGVGTWFVYPRGLLERVYVLQ
jgi:hypothetical protein